MNRYLHRRTLVTTLGTLGLGLGLIVTAAGGAPRVLAQEAATPAPTQDEPSPGDGEVREQLDPGAMREQLYAEFTAALATELGIGNSDEVDAAIRVAMMTVVDARVDEGLLTAGQAEALKTLIATSDVPLGPGPMFGPPGAFMGGGHGHGPEGWFFPGRSGDDGASRGFEVDGANDTSPSSVGDESDASS